MVLNSAYESKSKALRDCTAETANAAEVEDSLIRSLEKFMEFLGLEVNYLEEEGFKVYFRDLMNLSRTSGVIVSNISSESRQAASSNLGVAFRIVQAGGTWVFKPESR